MDKVFIGLESERDIGRSTGRINPIIVKPEEVVRSWESSRTGAGKCPRLAENVDSHQVAVFAGGLQE
jgi:hypothetical protein